jgi:hypothetical protein
VSEITAQKGNLPTKIEDLSKFVLVGREKITAVRAEIRAIDKLQLAEEVRNQKRDEAKMLSEALLDAEVRLGELFKEIPKATANNNLSGLKKDTQIRTVAELGSAKTKKEIVENLGFSEDQANRFEILAENKDIVEQVKAEARKNDDLPTRSRVLDLVDTMKKQERQYNDNLELGHEVYKQFIKIVESGRNFEITDERMKALRETLNLSDDFPGNPITDHIIYIDETIKNLNKIKLELLKGTGYKNVKR